MTGIDSEGFDVLQAGKRSVASILTRPVLTMEDAPPNTGRNGPALIQASFRLMNSSLTSGGISGPSQRPGIPIAAFRAEIETDEPSFPGHF